MRIALFPLNKWHFKDCRNNFVSDGYRCTIWISGKILWHKNEECLALSKFLCYNFEIMQILWHISHATFILCIQFPIQIFQTSLKYKTIFRIPSIGTFASIESTYEIGEHMKVSMIWQNIGTSFSTYNTCRSSW